MAETMKKPAAAAEALPGKRTGSAGKKPAGTPRKAAGGAKAAVRPEALGAVKKAPAKAKAAPAEKNASVEGKAASAKKAAGATKAAAEKKRAEAAKPGTAKESAAKTASGSGKGKASAVKKRAASKPRARSEISAEIRRKRAALKAREAGGDLFMEAGDKPKKKKSGGAQPPRKGLALFGALNLGLIAGIVLFLAFGVRQQAAYAEFKRMRDVVDQQTFYEGTTVEGVDVSNMTLSNAMDYWRDRVEARNEARAVTFDDGTTVTAKELGYSSDYASVLSAAWSAGRSGSLEERYHAAANRVENPVAYRITRSDYDAQILEAYVDQLAEQVDRPAKEASIASFDAQTYQFVFNEAEPGRKLDIDSLKASIAEAIRGGGGSVNLPVEVIAPETTTEEVSAQYGLIDYAITNASSSSKARLNNIKLAMSFINGTCVAPGETFSFNDTVGQRTASRGFRMATAYSGGDVTEQIGGGICQVSTTLFNAAVKADMEIVERHNHSLTVHYVDKGKDATVDWGHQDFRFKNTSDDNVYICCYLTDDKRVRFGMFGKLLPNGEKITLEATTTEVVKAETEYQQSAFLAPGQTYVLQEGRNGYKAEAYKVRWDAEGNQLSKELLCKSVYKVKNQIIQYGA